MLGIHSHWSIQSEYWLIESSWNWKPFYITGSSSGQQWLFLSYPVPEPSMIPLLFQAPVRHIFLFPPPSNSALCKREAAIDQAVWQEFLPESDSLFRKPNYTESIRLTWRFKARFQLRSFFHREPSWLFRADQFIFIPLHRIIRTEGLMYWPCIWAGDQTWKPTIIWHTIIQSKPRIFVNTNWTKQNHISTKKYVSRMKQKFPVRVLL